MSIQVPNLMTHSGRFHADDCIAYAVLCLALGLSNPGEDHMLFRTRDPAVLQSADIVWDVGGEYNPSNKRYDHHQNGAPVREDGSPYSSVGLVWRHYGRAAVQAILARSGVQELSDEVLRSMADEVDREVIKEIDLLDNGVVASAGSLGLISILDDFNSSWDHPDASLAGFIAAAEVAKGVLERRTETIRARMAAADIVARSAAVGSDPAILELAVGMPWQSAVFELGLPCVYAVFPVRPDEWMVSTLPTQPGGMEPCVPFPSEWAGLRDAELQARSGIPDAVFVHRGLFVAAAGSKEGALLFARRSLELAAEARLGECRSVR
jgi:uncharacterized UPF0160 family protein